MGKAKWKLRVDSLAAFVKTCRSLELKKKSTPTTKWSLLLFVLFAQPLPRPLSQMDLMVIQLNVWARGDSSTFWRSSLLCFKMHSNSAGWPITTEIFIIQYHTSLFKKITFAQWRTFGSNSYTLGESSNVVLKMQKIVKILLFNHFRRLCQYGTHRPTKGCQGAWY